MHECPTCLYSWDSHDETDAQRCYVQWQFRQRARAAQRSEDRALHRSALRPPVADATWASPAWRQPYVEPRAAA